MNNKIRLLEVLTILIVSLFTSPFAYASDPTGLLSIFYFAVAIIPLGILHLIVVVYKILKKISRSQKEYNYSSRELAYEHLYIAIRIYTIGILLCLFENFLSGQLEFKWQNYRILNKILQIYIVLTIASLIPLILSKFERQKL